MPRLPVVVAVLVALSAAPRAQPPSRPTFGAATSAVVVDVVVRDRQGRPITDLAIADFEIFEDGVAQEIGALSMVAPEVPGVTDERRRVYNTGISKATAAETVDRTKSEGDAPPGHTIVAILFENLSPENRGGAIRAATTYLDTPERPGDLVGVFSAGLALNTVTTFTNDRTVLRKALEAAAMQGTAREVDTRLSAAGAEVRGAAGTGGIDARVNALADVEAAINDGFRDLSSMQRGHGALDGLNAVVSGLARLPGRKTIIYFSEGLALRAGKATDGLVHRFNVMVERANAANVAVYPIDAMGLRVHSQQMLHGAEIQNASKGMLNGPDGGGMSVDMTNSIMEGGSTSHVFGRLAKETGGFVIESTNDLAAGFRRIDADRRFHYLLTYTPRRTEFSGEYRKIEVKVKRRNAVVRARSGYRADRSLATIPTQIYEAATLAALAADPRPTSLVAEARALRMPTAADPGQLAVLVRVPADQVRFETDAALGRFRSDVTVLARIRDEAGEVVRKASHPYRLDGPIAERARAAQGDLVFFRQPSLPPGRYTLEYAVADALGGRAGTGTVPFEIVAAAPSLLVAGDLVVARRAEAVKPGEVEANHALLVGGNILLYPNLGEPLAADTPQTVTLYVVVRPAAGRADLTASLAVARERQTVVTAPVTMAEAGEDGFIRQLIRIPLPALAAGSYTIRLDLSDGQNRTSRTARVTLAR
jgi:VWFA-related protein